MTAIVNGLLFIYSLTCNLALYSSLSSKHVTPNGVLAATKDIDLGQFVPTLLRFVFGSYPPQNVIITFSPLQVIEYCDKIFFMQFQREPLTQFSRLLKCYESAALS